ncbi:hypothetical protein AB205_0130800 [Aquarana catesbeiana]|uniref:Uncharacterized protein n=1 Tax=Aquarana catesbeiana TaxID=8400 RepID=A0A2G9RU59_AQUCT|nr:hypothetical protein AB205_0130800 [Aquarana catesbeiana]
MQSNKSRDLAGCDKKCPRGGGELHRGFVSKSLKVAYNPMFIYIQPVSCTGLQFIYGQVKLVIFFFPSWRPCDSNKVNPLIAGDGLLFL